MKKNKMKLFTTVEDVRNWINSIPEDKWIRGIMGVRNNDCKCILGHLGASNGSYDLEGTAKLNGEFIWSLYQKNKSIFPDRLQTMLANEDYRTLWAVNDYPGHDYDVKRTLLEFLPEKNITRNF